MPALTLFMTNSLAGAAHQEMSETSPGAIALASPATGWILATNAAGNYGHFDAQGELGRTAFNTTVKPGATIVSTAGAGNGLRSTNQYTGTFTAGDWVFTMVVQSVTAAYTGRFRIRARLYRSTSTDGSSGVTDIGGAADVLSAATVASLAVGADTTLSLTFSARPQVDLANEYLLMTLAAEPTSAGGGTTQDADMRIGNAATRLLTPVFTPVVPVIPDVNMAPWKWPL